MRHLGARARGNQGGNPGIAEKVQHPDLPPQAHVQVISDDRGFLMLPKARQRDGFVRHDSPDQAKRWGDRFNELWASSQTDPALRRFLL